MKARSLILTLVLLAGCVSRTSSRPVAPEAVTLTADDIARSPALSVEQLLAARVPGLTITTAEDGHQALHLRSVATAGFEREPLFVVNGVPLGDPANFAAIDRHDIASIEVVRDPGRTAMYGMRGANGVIVVKTKGS
jgi:TonB-dependent SusC/RagA subfamily outer membrane receptor